MYKTFVLSKNYKKSEIEFIRSIYPEIAFLKANIIAVPDNKAFRNTTPDFWDKELEYIVKNKPALYKVFKKVINKLTSN